MTPYCGRFAPTPSGPLHAGSLVAALASWLDARAHQGRWLVRIEDVDRPRTVAGAAQTILQQLQACHLVPDGPVLVQSERDSRYQQALEQLQQQNLCYRCYCSRKAIAAALGAAGLERERHGEWVYTGTCRDRLTKGLAVPAGAAAWRLDVARGLQRCGLVEPLVWHDRRLGRQSQDLSTSVGDFVLQRADGCTTYQLAVVVDDADQGVTDVVRGEDLCDNTARQILLQRALQRPTPRYLHTPLELDCHGEKLSKQTGAAPIASESPTAALHSLRAAARRLGLPVHDTETAIDAALWAWVRDWATFYNVA